MKITETTLRMIIREELLKEKKYKQLNEWDFSSIDPTTVATGIAAGSAALAGLRGLKLLFDKNRQSGIKQLTVDFINNAPRLFGLRNLKIQKVTLDDVEMWTEQTEQLSKMRKRGFLKYLSSSHRSSKDRQSGKPQVKLMSANVVYLLSDFNHRDARDIFIKDQNFSFDEEDKKFFLHINKACKNPRNSTVYNNPVYRLIDALFYCMIKLYVKKYSKKSMEAIEGFEKEMSQALRTKITVRGRNSWETKEDYEFATRRGNSQGPGRSIIVVPENYVKDLPFDNLIQIAEINSKYGRHMSTFVCIPYETSQIRGVDLIKLGAEIRGLQNRWEFFANVVITIKDVLRLGTSATVNDFIEKLLEKFSSSDEKSKTIADALVEAIKKSSLREGHVKEAIKFVIRVALS